MEKTKDLNTPGGNPVLLENPPFSEVGSMDSGGNQLLLNFGNIGRSNLTTRTPQTSATARSSKTTRTPPKNVATTININYKTQEKETPFTRSNLLNRSPPQVKTPTTIQQKEVKEKTEMSENFYEKWQDEVKARKRLEDTVSKLQQHIQDLQKIVTSLDKNESSMQEKSVMDLAFHTDDEELSRETDWILRKSKRPTKKRKPEQSPEILPQNKGNILSPKQKNPAINNKTIEDKEKKHTPPPIMVSGVATFSYLKTIIKKVTEKECKYTSYSNNTWKINVAEGDTYRIITSELSNKKIQWHTYENKACRPIKIMVRGLHPSCVEKEIVEDLSIKGFQILDAKNIIKKEKIASSDGEKITQKRGLPLFMLTFHNQENLDKIYAIKAIMGIVVKVEPMRKNSNLIPQCKRCQAFGHTQKYCQREYACVKCAGKHPTKNCTLKKEEKAKCINCRGEHPANYRGCEVAKDRQNRMNKQTESRHKKPAKINNVVSTPNKTTDNTSKSKLSQIYSNKPSYAQIVTNKRKEEEVSIKSLLSQILQRLDKQDKTIKALSDDVAKTKVKSNNINKKKVHKKS